MPVPYCFPCFATIHSNDPLRINHRFKDLENHDVKYLKCCECNESATRKCLGILHEDEIDEICNKLQRAPSENWKNILQQTNIGSDKRLTMILEQLTEGTSSDGAGTSVGTSSLMLSNNSPETINVTTRQQNTSNKVYLTPYQLQHIRMILERTRAECDECYCDRCYKDLHHGGKRANHR